MTSSCEPRNLFCAKWPYGAVVLARYGRDWGGRGKSLLSFGKAAAAFDALGCCLRHGLPGGLNE